MMQFTLKLTDADLDVLQISLIDHHAELCGAIRNERLCTNNEDTLERFRSDKNRIEVIMHQLKIQKEQQ
jgi:hypothetical protein